MIIRAQSLDSEAHAGSNATLELLDEINRWQQDVLAELSLEPNLMEGFLEEGGLIKRTTGATDAGHATCTAFCLYYLLRSDNNEMEAGPVRRVLTQEVLEKAATALGEAIVTGHPLSQPHVVVPSADNLDAAGVLEPSTADLPNHYNSSIQVAGYFRAIRLLGLKAHPEVLKSTRNVIAWLAARIKKFGGWAPRLEIEAPSAYLTYWTAAALEEWLISVGASEEGGLTLATKQALHYVGEWSEREVAQEVAFHHSGLTSRFDVIELIYSLACNLRFAHTAETVKLADHAITIVFNDYFADGCLAPSAPVLADKHNFSLQCPTAEALALLMLVSQDALRRQWKSLSTTSEWLSRNRREGEGWCPENVGRFSRPTAFMTSSAFSFLMSYANLLDEVLHSEAAYALHVPPFVPDPQLRDFQYPERIRDVLLLHVVSPLVASPRMSELASYSMILYGPPGTAKTTIAKKLAQDLEWPLLVVNQSAFLRQGVENIDPEADRLFRQISYLRDVVVLFDEIEELIQDRETPDKVSRLLTTAMLPRIHTLRDRRRVVFIFATNHEEKLDEAASRLGRFDIIRAVMPPDADERRIILGRLYRRFNIPDDVRQLFDAEGAVEKTDKFGYMDLYALVRSVAVMLQIEHREVDKSDVREALQTYGKRVDSDQYRDLEGRIEKSKRKLDRP